MKKPRNSQPPRSARGCSVFIVVIQAETTVIELFEIRLNGLDASEILSCSGIELAALNFSCVRLVCHFRFVPRNARPVFHETWYRWQREILIITVNEFAPRYRTSWKISKAPSKWREWHTEAHAIFFVRISWEDSRTASEKGIERGFECYNTIN